MSLPNVFTTPDGRGSAAHPVLLALYYSCPALVKQVLDSKTNSDTLTHAVKRSWSSLGSSNDCSAVWDLIGETLVPADSAVLFNQMCDLFDAELSNAATNALGVETRNTIQSGARVKTEFPARAYLFPLSIQLKADIEGTDLLSILRQNFEVTKIDYMFPDDIEPIESTKTLRISNVLHETVVLHFQRSRYDFGTREYAKIYDRIEFPAQISGKELSGFCEEGAVTQAISSATLDLVAVLTHNDENGYGLLLKPNANGPWFKCCGPEPILETSIESVFGGDIDQDVAYMLFYKVSGQGSLTRKMSKRASLLPATQKPTKVETEIGNKPQATKSEPASGGCCTMA